MIEDDAALVATVTWFRMLRREWLTQALAAGRPSECPVPDWSEVRPADRERFVRAMKVSLASARTDNVISTIEKVRAL